MLKSNMPTGWELPPIDDVVTTKIDQGIPAGEGDFCYVDISSVDNQEKRIREPKLIPVSEAPSRARQHIHAGDVLVSMTRPNLNAVALVDEEHDGAIASTGFDVLRPIGVDSRWLFARVKSKSFVDEMSSLVQGALYPAVKSKEVRASLLPLPPLNEQRRIADKIDALQAKSRRAREALEAVGPLLEKFRQSVLAAAFRGDLTAEWREKHPDVEPAEKLLERIRAERRARWEEAELAKMRAKGIKPKDDKWKAKYTEPEPVDATGLPELPEGWCWASVDEVAHVGTGATPKKGNHEFWSGGTVPWVTSGALNDDFVSEPQGYVTEKALAETNLTLFPCHTLLVAMYGEGKTRGKCSELSIEATTNQAIAGIQVSADDDVRGHLKSFMQYNYEQTRMAASGGVQPNLNLSIVKRIGFPLPPHAEIQAIAKVVQSLIGRMGEMTIRVTDAHGSLAKLDQSILAKAFRGELVPQDPNDEPASVLLERIKAEREAGTGRKTRKKPE